MSQNSPRTSPSRGALGESRQKTNTGLVVFARRISAPAGSTSRRTTICLPWKKTGEVTSASAVVASRVELCAETVVLKVLNSASTVSTASTLSTSTVSTLGTVSTLSTLRQLLL